MLMLALSRELESQLNPAGEKEDGARGAAGVPEGLVAQESTVTEPLRSGAACAAPQAEKPARNAAHERRHYTGFVGRLWDEYP